MLKRAFDLTVSVLTAIAALALFSLLALVRVPTVNSDARRSDMKGILAVVLTLVAGVVGGQPVPGIDGIWRLDPNKSPGYPSTSSAPIPEVMLTIRQTDGEITLERRSQGVRVTRYRIGEQTENRVGSLMTTARAEWQGGRLVVAGERPAADGTVVPYRTTFTLSEDLKRLTIEERFSASTTEFVSRQVFLRVGD